MDLPTDCVLYAEPQAKAIGSAFGLGAVTVGTLDLRVMPTGK